jgi:DNA-binding beta-propeller fold protein YncE
MAVNSKDIGHLVTSKVASNQIVFLTDLPGIASYEPSKSDIKKLSISFAENESDIADIAVYKQNSGLYVISKNDNEIYKHASIAAGFSSGEKWLKEPEGSPLSNPISLAIDGDIYVLQNDSTNPIIKLTKGLKSDFSMPEILTPINKATKIISDTGMKNLYILDPKNNRIVVISKTGNLVKQFISKKFDKLTDITINSAEKDIYILNGTMVYEIAL